MTQECTFALIKTHAADRGAAFADEIKTSSVVVEAIHSRIIRDGLMIAALKWLVPPRSQIDQLYREHVERPYYPALSASVSGRTVAMILSGDNAILRWRTMLGATNPANAAPDTLRANFGDHHKMVDNVAHGSDSEQAARREIRLFFPEFDLEGVWPLARAPVPPI